VPTTTPPSGGQVAYAQEEEGTKYNNLTSDASNFSNTVVLNVIQPGPFIQDDKLVYNLWTDMMDSAQVTVTDPQTVVYKIKAAAVWEDGQPIDCKDFYLAWGSQSGKAQKANPDYAPGKKDADGNDIPKTVTDFLPASTTGYENIKSVTCSDSNKTVTTVYDTPYADWKGLFGNLNPAHILETKTGIADITKVDLSADSPDTQKAAAFWNTGWANWDPSIALSGSWYKIKDYTQGTGITLVRNDKFWGKPAQLDTIVLRTINDATAEAQALENGELQVIQPQADPAVADTLSKATGVKFAPQAGLTFEHLDLNLKNPVFQDLAVRQAFALCIDRADIVGKLVAPVNPNEKPMDDLLLVPEQAGYTPHLAQAGFDKMDIAKSKSLLEGAGWKLGGDGYYAKGSLKLAFRISEKGIARRVQEVQLIIASCKAAGFKITEDSDKKFNAVRLPLGDYDVALFAWVGTPFLSSATSIYVPGGGQNWQGYNNPKIKDLYDQANKEFDDAKRLDLINQIDTQLIADMISIPLFQLPDMLAYSDKLSNVKYNGPLGITWNANEWVLAS
jgi:peptide/nickel transport system substrate-binding protein